MRKAYINVCGINFGEIEAEPEQYFAIQVFNPITHKKSDLFTFRYKNHNNFHQKFSTDIIDKNTQQIEIYLHRVNSILTHKIASIKIPFAAFPENKVCHEVVEMSSGKKNLSFPISIVFDMHLNFNGDPAFQAPEGKSLMKTFDVQEHRIKYSTTLDQLPSSHKRVKSSNSLPLLDANLF